MATESWLALGAGLLLGMGILAQGLVIVRLMPGWGWPVTAMRVSAAVLLAVAYAVVAMASGQWAPVAPRQTILGLALAVVVVHLVLIWWLRSEGPGMMADTLALVLSLVALAARPGADLLTCVQEATAFGVQWAFFVLGAGAAMVSGACGLRIAARALMAKIGHGAQPPRRVDLYVSLKHATVLSWLALGAGLVLATWWAWRSMGSLSGVDLHTWWIVIAWLVSWIGLLSWHLGKRCVQWAAGLAVLAASIAIIGLLVVPGLPQVLGS